MKIQVLIDKNSWAKKNQKFIKTKLLVFDKNIKFFTSHKSLKKDYDLNIIFSYFKFIPKQYLNNSKYNIIPHESKLPKGRGMSPLSWQILEGKSKIYFSLISAGNKIDNGKIFYQKKYNLKQHLLFKELKEKQLHINLNLITKFIKKINKKQRPKTIAQKGSATYYKTRTPNDSEIDINKSIKSQINLLRLCDDNNYPAFFYYKSKKFLIKLEKVKK